jgi:uncharacterized membrane protein YheB (UPF0754 family)
MPLVYIALPLISAFIGWITNWVAIKMLFHPKQPKRFLGLTIHGVFPKNQLQFASKLGKLVNDELLSFNDIASKITSPQNLEAVANELDGKIGPMIKDKINDLFPMASMFIGSDTINKIKTAFSTEIRNQLPQLMNGYMNRLQSDLDLQKIVYEKVSAFSTDKLEDILKQIMSKEFRFIEILGGVLGFIIGVIQVFITQLLK